MKPFLGGEVHYAQFTAFNRPMHPLAAIKEYKRLIAEEPHDGELYVRLSNIYRRLYRHQDALELLRKGQEADPYSAELIFHRAMAEHDFGDKKMARRLYLQAKQMFKSLASFDAEALNMRWLCDYGLRALERDVPSPWGLETVEMEPEIMDARPEETPPSKSKGLSRRAARKKGSRKKKHRKRRRR